MTTPTQEAAIQAMYAAVDEEIREDLGAALDWARTTLTNHEGAGHIFNVLPYLTLNRKFKGLSCEFSKPEWSGSHASRPMATASEAMVMAVCEYLNGA
jgi:hypothetical protein